jgi:lysophospholipase L1-like esterase
MKKYKKKSISLLVLVAISFISFTIVKPKNKTTIWMCGDSTMSIKETKNYPETGWGMPFVHFWDTTVQVKNLAKNGRSTKTFINEKLWAVVMDNAKEGDYVFIQFGHNDEVPTKKSSYTTPDTFTLNLNKFINEAKAKKAIPVLFTPVSRRKFDSAGIALPTHKEYSLLVAQVAKSQNCIFIDMDTKTRELYQKFGVENSKLLFLQLQKGEHPNYPDGKEDNTHFSELGARLVAQIALKELKLQIPDLTERIIKPIVKK